MGDYWWLLLVGAGMWAVMIAVIVFGKRNPDACPSCGHIAGLSGSRKHCENADSYSGWGSDQCPCQNDYHRSYESTAAERL